jgi:hypothetical protein
MPQTRIRLRFLAQSTLPVIGRATLLKPSWNSAFASNKRPRGADDAGEDRPSDPRDERLGSDGSGASVRGRRRRTGRWGGTGRRGFGGWRRRRGHLGGCAGGRRRGHGRGTAGDGWDRGGGPGGGGWGSHRDSSGGQRGGRGAVIGERQSYERVQYCSRELRRREQSQSTTTILRLPVCSAPRGGGGSPPCPTARLIEDGYRWKAWEGSGEDEAKRDDVRDGKRRPLEARSLDQPSVTENVRGGTGVHMIPWQAMSLDR